MTTDDARDDAPPRRDARLATGAHWTPEQREAVQAYVRLALSDAPPLSDAQVRRLRRLFDV